MLLRLHRRVVIPVRRERAFGMVTMSSVLTDPLAADVGEVCDRLSAALGWRVDFDPSPNPSMADEHHSATETGAGRVRLKPAESMWPRTDYPVAVATAEAVSVLLARLRTALKSLESRSREVSTLMEMGRLDRKREGLSPTIEHLLAAAVELTGFWSAAFFLIDPAMKSLRLRTSWRIEASDIPQFSRSLQIPTPDAQALFHGAILLERQEGHGLEWLPDGCSTALAVPVRSADGPLGTLWCFERRRHAVSPHCVKVLKSVAAQLARTLERTVLLRESAVRKRLRNELKTASRHQNISRKLPVRADCGIDVAMRAASASELSGDLCEVCPLDATRTFLAVGDAVGHSIPAAMVMAVARGAMRALVHDGDACDWQPHQLIRRINRALCSSTSAEQFMSVVAGIIDHGRGTFTYSNAGHPPPWLIRGGVRTALKSHGMLCGVLVDGVYQQSEIPLETGDLLVFFTDGLSEALSPQRQLFRAEGVLNALVDRPWETADTAANAIWQRMCEHTGHREATDDQTLLVIHVRGPFRV